MRMNCNLFRAIRYGYLWNMLRYCRAWGWRYFWLDTFFIGKLEPDGFESVNVQGGVDQAGRAFILSGPMKGREPAKMDAFVCKPEAYGKYGTITFTWKNHAPE